MRDREIERQRQREMACGEFAVLPTLHGPIPRADGDEGSWGRGSTAILVEGPWFRVQGLGFRVEGGGFGV